MNGTINEFKLSEKRTRKFWSKVKKSDGCWEWDGWRDRFGYGAFKVGNTRRYAHRISYFLSNGKIPDGLGVLHKCDNRACVRPDHLFPGTQQDNVDDCVKKGRKRCVFGSSVHTAKLTDKDVFSIRFVMAPSGISRREIANRFGVTVHQVGSILRMECWRHVKFPDPSVSPADSSFLAGVPPLSDRVFS